jgi:hypothetical protein
MPVYGMLFLKSITKNIRLFQADLGWPLTSRDAHLSQGCFFSSARMRAPIHRTQAPIGTFKLAFFRGKAGALLLLKAKCSIIGDASLQGSTHTPENKS